MDPILNIESTFLDEAQTAEAIEQSQLLAEMIESAEEIGTVEEAALEEHIEAAAVEIIEEAKLADRFPGVKLPAKEHREMVLRVKVGQAGIVNGNKRYYPKELLKREVNRLSEKIAKGSVLSNDQHPRRKVVLNAEKKPVIEAIDVPTFGSTTAIPVSIEMNEAGEIFSTMVVPKTDAGRNYAAVIRAGGRPGISTRGQGSSKKKEIKFSETDETKEVLVVQSDYTLKTFDTVIDQSVQDAGIREMSESHSELQPEQTVQKQETMKFKTLNEWKSAHPKAFEDLQESIQAGEIKAIAFKDVSESLYESLETDMKASLTQSLTEALEGKVTTDLSEKFDEYCESVRESIKNEEIEEAQSEAIALFLAKIGVDESIATALKGHLEEGKEETFQAAFKQTLVNLGVLEGEKTTTSTKDESHMDESAVKDLISEAIYEANKPLKEQLQSLNEELIVTKRDKAIAECLGSFPYNDKTKARVKTLLESVETAEEVTAIYEGQIELLKESGAKEEVRGSAKFLATDESSEEGQPKAQVRLADESPENYAQRLIDEAAGDFEEVSK